MLAAAYTLIEASNKSFHFFVELLFASINAKAPSTRPPVVGIFAKSNRGKYPTLVTENPLLQEPSELLIDTWKQHGSFRLGRDNDVGPQVPSDVAQHFCVIGTYCITYERNDRKMLRAKTT
jgi:hypothetical protein